ncbi:hypothetical protein F3K50_06155 [Pseudomonas marginalis]|nr:hypothetical protein F3K50_06155 [Pseudomonas marginalis]
MSDKPDGTYTRHDGTKADIYVLSSPANSSGGGGFRVTVKLPDGSVSHGYNQPTKEAAYERGIQIADEAIEKKIQCERS